MTSARIAALNVYPVKSCRGIACERAQVTVRGLAIAGVGDREWMIVDGTGRFVTQREQPRLARIEVAVAMACCGSTRGPDTDVPLAGATDPARQVVVWNSTVRRTTRARCRGGLRQRSASTWARPLDPAQERRCRREYAGDPGATPRSPTAIRCS
jgi:uncharacterized protein YcbX